MTTLTADPPAYANLEIGRHPLPPGLEVTDEFMRQLQELNPDKIVECWKNRELVITVGAGGGTSGIALSCDIRIASDKARFSETFIRRGLIPADGSCWQLPRMIGLSGTFILQYTGDAVDAQEAYRLGMVSKVAPHADLMDTTLELATRIAQGPTYSMAMIKRLVHKSLHTDLAESLRLAGPAQNIARRTSDHQEGVRAFVEKRQPRYVGR